MQRALGRGAPGERQRIAAARRCDTRKFASVPVTFTSTDTSLLKAAVSSSSSCCSKRSFVRAPRVSLRSLEMDASVLVGAAASVVGFALRAAGTILRARYEGKVSEADTCAVVAHG